MHDVCCVDDMVNMNITDLVEPIQYGWELKEETNMSVDSRDDIAPEEQVIDLVSCNCNGDSSKGRCTSKKNNVASACYRFLLLWGRMP